MAHEPTAPQKDAQRESSLSERLEEFRRVRAELERAILPLAGSVDGRNFDFQASLHNLELQTGGYVVLETDDQTRLGQILTLEHHSEQSDLSQIGHQSTARIRAAHGRGIVLDGDGRTFHDAAVRVATSDDVRAWMDRVRPSRAALDIGRLLLADGVPAELDAGGFNRHTFMCGQSGSGKTYSLGLVLERLLVGTTLRIVILDPNSDYVRLAHGREGVGVDVAHSYAEATTSVAVWQHSPDAEHQLGFQFHELDPAAQGASLGLDPIADRDEYAALIELLDEARRGQSLLGRLDDLLSSADAGARRLGVRASNLGVLDWSIWTGGKSKSLVDELENPSARCLVVDLGSLDSAAEQRVVAETVLSTLWRNRARREPCLIVIDEAHNVCPRQPADTMTRLAADYAAMIAAEGRKFGLYLLTSTQRPQKVNEEVLTQCDNLLLMRMNSEADLGYLREVFSFVPSGLIGRATSFRLGQSLVAGKYFPYPAYVQFGDRVSQEGGSDIPTTWATPQAKG